MLQWAQRFLCLGAAPAYSADMPEAPIVEVQQFGGWYLRGDIGMSNQRFDELDYVGFDDPVVHGWHNDGEISTPALPDRSVLVISLMIGSARMSTAQYRGKTEFSALDFYDTDGIPGTGDEATNSYHAKKSEWLLLANAYTDLGTYGGITPYVGAGIGASRNTISGFTDDNIITGGGGFAGSEFAMGIRLGAARRRWHQGDRSHDH